MTKPIAIIAGEPNSISSEIIFKSWKNRKKYFHKPFFIIGSINLLKLQNKKLKYNIKIKEIYKNFKLKDYNKNELLVYNINYIQKKAFQKISNRSSPYIFKCFNVAIKLIKEKKILGIINCPVAKEFLFKKKQLGITEFLSKKAGILGNEVMLIFNKKLAVTPITTHISISQISGKLKKKLIVKKVRTINNFYIKNFNKRPNIVILGLNPHNYSIKEKSEETEVISPAVKLIRKLKIKIIGPVSADTSFMLLKKYKIDVIIGMYHDQVLTPFKTLFNYKAVNITLGLPYIRISPDHGTALDIAGKNIANPESLIESIKLFNYLK